MNKLNLTFSNPQTNGTFLAIDGNIVFAKKDKKGHQCVTYETEKDTVEISLYKYLEINNPFYILWQLLFFVISLFGIFNTRLEKLCTVRKYKAIITLSEETNVNIRINTNYKDQRAAIIETTAEIEEQENIKYVDKTAKKRLKILNIIKALLWIALIGSIVALVIITIGD